MLIEKPDKHYDITIVGGGMVGASFALALCRAIHKPDFSILVVESFAPGKNDIGVAYRSSFDARSTALSYGSSRLFDNSGLWKTLKDKVASIEQIHVSDRGKLGSTTIHCTEQKLPALGYVVENRDLGVVLNAALSNEPRVHLWAPAKTEQIKPNQEGMALSVSCGAEVFSVQSKLTVLADGGKSPLCQQLGIRSSKQEYGQNAIIANIAFEKPHKNMAYERFTETGPLAVLPLTPHEGLNRGSLVWTLASNEVDSILSLPEAALKKQLQQSFGYRLGEITRLGETFNFPLALSVAKEQVRPGLVLLGNVAHTLHPVAGQGLNLALRDVKALVDVLVEAQGNGIGVGDMSVLQAYVDGQQSDQSRTIDLTHYLTKTFSSENTVLQTARKFGLMSIDLLPPVRQRFAKQAMGLSDQ